jgi:ABC-type nitrate/sulfonate/bicarbonate transport system substrate-binding protein
MGMKNVGRYSLRNRFLFVAALVIAFALVLAACGDDADVAEPPVGDEPDVEEPDVEEPDVEEPDEELPALRIVNQENLFSITSVVAEDQGMFEAHGVDVDHMFNPSGAERASLVIGGEADASILGIVSGFRGVVTGDWHFVATQVQAGNANYLSCDPDLGIQSLADLAGRGLTIAAADGSGTYETFRRIMAPEYGLTDDDWNLVNLDVAERVAAVVGGSADCMLNQEPQTTTAINDGFVEIVEDGGTMGDFDPFHLVLYVSTAFLDQPGGEEATERFLAALVDAGEFIENDPQRAADIYAEFLATNIGIQIDDPDLLPIAIERQEYQVCLDDDFRNFLDVWAEIAVDTGEMDEDAIPDWDEVVRWDLNHRATGGC